MRVRHERPQRTPVRTAFRKDGCARIRNIAQQAKRIVAAKVSSRQPSTPQVTISSSVAVRNAAMRPTAGDSKAAPTRYVAKIISVDPVADARLTPESWSSRAHSPACVIARNTGSRTWAW